MYFVNTRKKLTSHNFLLHMLPAGAVMITVLGLSVLGWRNASESFKTERDNATRTLASDIQRKIQDRLNAYELVLTGGSSLFLSSQEVTRGEWKNFVSSFDLQNKYPGIKTVGYLAFVKPAEVPALTQRIRDEGYPDFHIFPSGDRPIYTSVLYYEPAMSGAGLGYDMYSEPTRQAAIIRAQETGKPSMTAKIAFVKDKTSLGENGFTMFMPVYADNFQLTLPPRQRNVVGFTYAPISAQKVFQETLNGLATDRYAMRVYDSSTSAQNILFESENFKTLNSANHYSYSKPVELYGRRWILDYRLSPEIIPETTRNRPVNSLVAGFLFSLLLSGFVLTLLVARTRSLAHSKQMEVQDAKDELLSLASHQLRTPATSVKQYLGMLREGFVGKLSKPQTEILAKAYESNERQLHIINELLYVAKIDAKGIVLTPRKINLNKLIRDLTKELEKSAKKSKQKVRLQLPSRTVNVEADEHCLRMSLENLISNAFKYSYETSTVTIKLISKRDAVEIAIKDKGIGLDADEIPLLFQRFSRIPNEMSQQTNGSGIGLYLSQQLINLHGGDITVDSEKGKGTVFTIILPKSQNFDI